jgi:hypothetical protein
MAVVALMALVLFSRHRAARTPGRWCRQSILRRAAGDG